MHGSKDVTGSKKGADTSTTFITVKWSETDDGIMSKAKVEKKTVSNGEAAMAKIKTPY